MRRPQKHSRRHENETKKWNDKMKRAYGGEAVPQRESREVKFEGGKIRGGELMLGLRPLGNQG